MIIIGSFHKPKKMETIPPVKPYTTQTEWEKHIQSEFTKYRKYMQRSESRKKGDGFSTFDFVDAMSKRRQKAILNYIPEIYKRYKAPDTNQPSIGKAWTDLNIPFLTHSHMDAQSHILFAASMWILDQITRHEDWRKVYRLLPTDDRILDELCRHDAWDSEHEYDLIYSIEHVLHHRNPIEIDGAGYPRTITSEWLAKKKAEPSVDRQNYEALIAMIPQEAIDAAVAKFRALFWQWTDRFYETLAPFTEAVAQCDDELRESRVSYNKLVDEFSAAVDRAEKLRRQKPKTPAVIPFAAPAKLNVFEMQRDPLSILGQGSKSDLDRAVDEALAISVRLDRVGTHSDELIDKANELYRNERTYVMHITRQGRIMNDGLTDFGQILVQPMEPMRIDDPYALCFALLYLAEADDDLPWLYGACCGFMGEVVEPLPWGIFEYDELDDDIWDGGRLIADDAALPKSVQIPDAYERKYRMKGGDFNFPRNLAQIIYEETGCVLPRNLHIYDSRAKMLGRYGIKGKDAASALMLMSTLAAVRHSSNDLNLDTDIDAILGEEEKKETPTAPIESVDDLKAEIKRLRAALHASDKENRETKKSLASITAAAEREHRELADLREYVFNDERETDAPEGDKIDESCWPYSVQKDTVVFGGHPSWARGIRGLLTGNIRFIDKDMISFDAGIIRHADVLWIQPNAMSHTMYYRIVDTARTYGKPVRYFGYASWAKCAEQVVEGEK